MMPAWRKLKTKKSSKKVITEDFYHPSEEKKTNKFKLLSDADLHVKNLLSKYLLTIDRTEHTFDVVNKLKHLEEQKNKKPKLKLFDLSEEDDCFIFDTEREANECLKLIFNNGDWIDDIQYGKVRYYVERVPEKLCNIYNDINFNIVD